MKVYYINQLNQIELTIDEPFGSNRGGSNRRLEISMGKNKKEDTLMDKVVSLSKRRGFVYPGSEVYGGLANAWDFGPLGVELLNNLKQAWWKKFVIERTDMVGLDAAILMNPQTWVASGHVGSFSDPLMDCKKCKSRERADKLVEKWQFDNQSDLAPANWAGEKPRPRTCWISSRRKPSTAPTAGPWTGPCPKPST